MKRRSITASLAFWYWTRRLAVQIRGRDACTVNEPVPHLLSPRGRPLAHAPGDDTEMGALRNTALQSADGTDWSRVDDHQVVEHVAAAVLAGRLPGSAQATRAPLRRLVANVAAPAASPPPPAPSPPAAAPSPASAPAAADTTFGLDLDVAAMVATLMQAAQDGTPFCEECARAAAAQQQAAA